MNLKTDPLKPVDVLPRYDLREKAFKKYERYINQALHEAYTFDPILVMQVRPTTFICRFRDAILGFQRYHYPSILFSQSADFAAIRLYETSDGKVSIVNTRLAGLAAKETQGAGFLHDSRDISRIMEIGEI